MKIEKSKSESLFFESVKLELIKNIDIYYRFINWVTGEFDLFFKNESKELKIYFPNGFFEIELFSGDRDVIAVIQIKVSGKSRTTCEKIMIQLENIYQHVLLFNKNKTI
jgi:hypothetical protein